MAKKSTSNTNLEYKVLMPFHNGKERYEVGEIIVAFSTDELDELLRRNLIIGV